MGSAPVAQAFQPAGSGDFPVASSRNAGQECPANPQTGMSALHVFGNCGGVWPLLVTALFLCPPTLKAQSTQDAISREVSAFNYGSLAVPSANTEAISREVSTFNYGSLNVPSAGTEAVSREVSAFNYGSLAVPSSNTEAISREVSVFNYGLLTYPSVGIEAISREVSVINYGNPPVLFSVGSTNSLGSAVGQVPFTLQTYLDLTNLSLTLLTDDSHLQVLGVTPVAPEVLTVTLGTPGVNSHPISFTLNSAAIPLTNHTLAYLNFQGVTNLDSAIVPLTISNLSGFRANGQFAPGVATNGQVILIVTRPILFPTNRLPFGFTMYGIPGATYSIQATTNLVPSFWLEVQNLLETGPTLTVTGLTNRGSQQFYRAQQVGP